MEHRMSDRISLKLRLFIRLHKKLQSTIQGKLISLSSFFKNTSHLCPYQQLIATTPKLENNNNVDISLSMI